jgi:CRISPR-associated protein Cas5h
MKEQFLVFDWQGLIGHFRKLDTNSSSLSYSFPPPTAISGMRPEYVEWHGTNTIRNSVLIIFNLPFKKQKNKKILQTVNYMFVKIEE